MPAVLATFLVWGCAPRIFAGLTLPADNTADRLAVNPMGRAFGMVLTALPTVIALVWLGLAAA